TAITHADDPAAPAQRTQHLRAAQQLKRRLSIRRASQQLKKIPLRDHRDRHPWRPECALARRVAVNQSSFAIDILAGESRELFGQTEVRQKLPGARMHSVTAEVTHEVGML